MFSRLLGRAAPARPHAEPAAPSRRSEPDAGYDALPRFDRLAAELASAVREATLADAGRSRWKEGRLFFFDCRRQAELQAARTPPAPRAEPFRELSDRISAELPALYASVELRHVARAVAGLRESAAELAPLCVAVKELASLLAVPDDEVVVVLNPAARTGWRVAVSGVADVGQFHVLLAAATDEGSVPRRFVSACRGADPTTPAGVPMVPEARFQMYAPAALRPDGSLPDGFAGSDHWLWPQSPLASVPRAGGERVVVCGPPAFRQTWEVSRRFPSVPADVRLLEVLNPFRVASRLGELVGRPVSPTPAVVTEPALAEAA